MARAAAGPMERKTVFGGSFMVGDVPEADRPALQLALATLKSLSDRGIIDFRRGAGRTVGLGRNPENPLTPIAMDVLRAATESEGRFTVGDMRSATGHNGNSLTANLHKLSVSGFLDREQKPLPPGARIGGHTHQWTYGITDRGREAVAEAAPDASAPGRR